MHHISGQNIYVMIGAMSVNIKQYTLNIEDGVKAVTTRGIPHGHVDGEVSASGEITLDTENYKIVVEEARKAGSFQKLPTFDIIGLGQTVDQSLKTAAYGCKLKLSKVLDASGDGNDKLEHTIPYEVTDSRFVEIDGVPYLDIERIESLGL